VIPRYHRTFSCQAIEAQSEIGTSQLRKKEGDEHDGNDEFNNFTDIKKRQKEKQR
jgi:hypothetical protein